MSRYDRQSPAPPTQRVNPFDQSTALFKHIFKPLEQQRNLSELQRANLLYWKAAAELYLGSALPEIGVVAANQERGHPSAKDYYFATSEITTICDCLKDLASQVRSKSIILPEQLPLLGKINPMDGSNETYSVIMAKVNLIRIKHSLIGTREVKSTSTDANRKECAATWEQAVMPDPFRLLESAILRAWHQGLAADKLIIIQIALLREMAMLLSYLLSCIKDSRRNKLKDVLDENETYWRLVEQGVKVDKPRFLLFEAIGRALWENSQDRTTMTGRPRANSVSSGRDRPSSSPGPQLTARGRSASHSLSRRKRGLYLV